MLYSGSSTLKYRNGEKPIHVAAGTCSFASRIFYKAGNGKVIKCKGEKLQNYDISVSIGAREDYEINHHRQDPFQQCYAGNISILV